MKNLYIKNEILEKFKVGNKGFEQLIVKGIVEKITLSDTILRYRIAEEEIKSDEFQDKFVVEYIKPVKSESSMRIDVPYVRRYKTKKKGVVYYFGVNKHTADKVYAATGFLLKNKKFTDFREAEKYAWDMYEKYIKYTLKSYSKQHICKGSLKYLWKEFKKFRFVKENESPLNKTLAERTQKDYIKCYEMLSNVVINSNTKLVDVDLTKISRKQAKGPLYEALNESIKVRWAKMCMDFIRAIFNFGLNMDIISGENPFARLGIPQGTKEQRLWKPEEIEKFCTTAYEMGRPEHALAVKLNSFISDRPADYKKLRVSDIKKDENGEYYFETVSNKTNVTSFAYFPEELYNEIDKNKDKLVNVSSETFDRIFRKIAVKAGLEGCTFKNIRNTAITKYFDAGANVSEVVSISGHKKAETSLNNYRQNTKKQAHNGYVKIHMPQNQTSLDQTQVKDIVEQVVIALAKKTEIQ